MSTRRAPAAASRSKAARSSQDPTLAFASAFAATFRAYAAQLGVEELSQGSVDYAYELAHAADLHIRKVVGYGTSDDAWANFRRVQDMGLDPVVGIVVRMNDKMSRINNLVASDGHADMLGEPLERELEDLAGYSHIGRCMIVEAAR